MSDAVITCPHCRRQIELTEAISAPIEAALRRQFEQQTKQVAEAERKRAADEFAVQAAALQTQLRDQQRRLDDARHKELLLVQRERELDERRQAIELDVQRRLREERDKLAEQVRREANRESAERVRALQESLAARDRKLQEAEQHELSLRNERSRLQDQMRALELTVQRRVDEEREKVRLDEQRRLEEDFRLKESEKDQKIAGMLRQIDELKRKGEQGSQQTQGEAMELELERVLRDAFPHDRIEPVPTGMTGGDTLQYVHSPGGMLCGTILWESKRTKVWQDGWLAKLRDDQRAARADLAVLTSATLPKEVRNFARVDGVWVTCLDCAINLAGALRIGLMDVAGAKQAIQGQRSKIELVYNYLSGPQFRHRIEAIVEAFTELREELESEKRAVQRIWAKREKQLERALASAAGLGGDLQGIIGSDVLDLPCLEFQPLIQRELDFHEERLLD